ERRDPDSVRGELCLHSLGLFGCLEHHRKRRDALALGLEEFMERVSRPKRLDELEVKVTDHGFRPADLELGWFSLPFRVMHDPGAVRLVDLPRAPAERLVVVAHPLIQVTDGARHLGDRVSDPADRRWTGLRARGWVDLGRLDEIDGVAAAGFDQAAELVLG